MTPQTWSQWFFDGFSRRSMAAIAALLLLYGAVGLNWWELVDLDQPFDFLLVGIWGWMTLLLTWRLDRQRDLPLVLVGLCGGAVIEWWGTNSLLWTYFTLERPPLWILPAWPIAALTIDRMVRMVDRGVPGLRRLGPLYWLIMPAFVALMVRFMWVRIDLLSSQVVVGLMLAVTFLGARPRRDVVMFLVGASFGILLEYWGTSRRCWTYYTGQTPPLEAVLAHGFATVAFARAVQLLDAAQLWFRRPQPS